MRIIHVITRFIRGGADENTLYSCNAQAALGHQVLLLHGDEFDEPLRNQLDWRVVAMRLPSLRRSIHPLHDWRAYAACVKLFRKWQPDIVHTHTSKAGIVADAGTFLDVVNPDVLAAQRLDLVGDFRTSHAFHSQRL